MSEIIQKLLFEHPEEEKPDLNDALAHYGVLGMKWGVRKDRRKKGTRRKKRWKYRTIEEGVRYKQEKKIKNKRYKTNEEAIKAKDVVYINKHKGNFSTDELNRVMNRINTEQRISQMAYEQSTYAKVTRSKAFKAIAGAAIGGITYATVNYIMTGDKASIPKNLAVGAAVGGVTNLVPGTGDLKKLKKDSKKKK